MSNPSIPTLDPSSQSATSTTPTKPVANGFHIGGDGPNLPEPDLPEADLSEPESVETELPEPVLAESVPESVQEEYPEADLEGEYPEPDLDGEQPQNTITTKPGVSITPSGITPEVPVTPQNTTSSKPSVSITASGISPEAPITEEWLVQTVRDLDVTNLNSLLLARLQVKSSKHKFLVQSSSVRQGDASIRTSFGAVWDTTKDGYVSIKVESAEATTMVTVYWFFS